MAFAQIGFLTSGLCSWKTCASWLLRGNDQKKRQRNSNPAVLGCNRRVCWNNRNTRHWAHRKGPQSQKNCLVVHLPGKSRWVCEHQNLALAFKRKEFWFFTQNLPKLTWSRNEENNSLTVQICFRTGMLVVQVVDVFKNYYKYPVSTCIQTGKSLGKESHNARTYGLRWLFARNKYTVITQV